jgi:hypothetical protein
MNRFLTVVNATCRVVQNCRVAQFLLHGHDYYGGFAANEERRNYMHRSLSIPYQFLCHRVRPEDVKAMPDLTFRLFCSVAFHNIRYGISRSPHQFSENVVTCNANNCSAHPWNNDPRWAGMTSVIHLRAGKGGGEQVVRHLGKNVWCLQNHRTFSDTWCSTCDVPRDEIGKIPRPSRALFS